MKLAIMQPYLFPYIGYFQLIKAVDRFVVYDDVNFIKQGWINRNNILVQGKPLLFTVPLKNQSSFLKINESLINEKFYETWKSKFLRTIEQSYKNAPYFKDVYTLIDRILNENYDDKSISDLAVKSIIEVSKYLEFKTEFVLTSSSYNNHDLNGKERVIDICIKEKALHYINPVGGQELYDKNYFKERNLELNFIKSLPVQYAQFKNEFVPWLSIIDVLMFNSVEETNALLMKYELI